MTNDLIEQARNFYKSGNKNKAKELLLEASIQDPTNITIWLGLSYCTEDPLEKAQYLEHILQIDPQNKQAQKSLEEIKKQALPKNKINSDITPEVKTVYQKNRQKSAGQSTFDLADKRRKTGLFFGGVGIVLVLCVGSIFILPGLSSKMGSNSLLGVFVFLFFVIIPLINIYTKKKSKEFRRAARGAKAEIQVETLLCDLDEDEYEIFHDVEYEYGNIDHIVINKSGNVFMIETKSHHGEVTIYDETILMNNKPVEKDFISQSLRNTYWLREQIQQTIGIKTWITPILVFTNAFVPYIQPIKGVYVVNQKYLIRTIEDISNKKKANPLIWEQREEIASRF